MGWDGSGGLIFAFRECFLKVGIFFDFFQVVCANEKKLGRLSMKWIFTRFHKFINKKKIKKSIFEVLDLCVGVCG